MTFIVGVTALILAAGWRQSITGVPNIICYTIYCVWTNFRKSNFDNNIEKVFGEMAVGKRDADEEV